MLPQQNDLGSEPWLQASDTTAESQSAATLARMLQPEGTDDSQRIDLAELRFLQDISPAKVLERLLQSPQPVRCMARVRPPRSNSPDHGNWLRQQALMTKLQKVASGGSTDETAPFFLGFPILRIRTAPEKFVAAPVAFIPIALRVWDEAMEIQRRGNEGIAINPDLLTWLHLFGQKLEVMSDGGDELSQISRWIECLARSFPELCGTAVLRWPIDLQPISSEQSTATPLEIICAAELGQFSIASEGEEIHRIPQSADLFANVPPENRTDIAERLSDLLMSVDPALLNHWAGAEPRRVHQAKRTLDELSQAMAVFRGGPLDEQLRSRIPSGSLDIDLLTRHAKLLRRYGQAYREASGILAALQAQAPDVPLMVLAKWASWDAQRRQQALRRLRMMGSMARAIEAEPLDRQFAPHLRRQPLTSQQVNQHLTVLQDYLESRAKWLTWTRSSLRRDATAATAYFDEKLSAASAEKVRAFLHGVRLRIDFVAELQNELEESPGPLPTDEELLRLFADHGVAASLVMNAPLPITGAAELPSMAVHQLMNSQDCAAMEILAEWNLTPGAVPADRLATFLSRVAARLQLIDWWNKVQPDNQREHLPPDVLLERTIRSHQQCLEFLSALADDSARPILRRPIAQALRNPVVGLHVIQALRRCGGDAAEPK